MPRIDAETVAEHVANKEAEVIDTATRLFAERGYRNVSLGDIATEIGMGRTSLYRYVPDKAHLLVLWFRLTVPRLLADWQPIFGSGDDPADRLADWSVAYLSELAGPTGPLISALLDELGSLPEPATAEVWTLHQQLMAPIEATVEQAGVSPDEVNPVLELVSTLILGASRAERANPFHTDALRSRVRAATTAILR